MLEVRCWKSEKTKKSFNLLSDLPLPTSDLQKPKGGEMMAILEGKKAIVVGDRDGIPGPAIAECVKTAGAEVIFSSTECFV